FRGFTSASIYEALRHPLRRVPIRRGQHDARPLDVLAWPVAIGRDRIGVSRPTVWRWQQRFAESGVAGLRRQLLALRGAQYHTHQLRHGPCPPTPWPNILRDKTRKPGKPPIAAETTARVVALTCTEPPHQATHWTGRAMATAIGISLGS